MPYTASMSLICRKALASARCFAAQARFLSRWQVAQRPLRKSLCCVQRGSRLIIGNSLQFWQPQTAVMLLAVPLGHTGSAPIADGSFSVKNFLTPDRAGLRRRGPGLSGTSEAWTLRGHCSTSDHNRLAAGGNARSGA